MDSLNIVFYGIKYFPSKGGTSRVAENIIKNLSSYNISIYCYKNPNAKDNIPGVKTYQLPKFGLGGIGVFFYYLISAIHLLFVFNKKTIIHAHKTDCAFFLPILKLKFKKIVATSHEAPYHRDKWNKLGKMYFRIAEKIFINSGVTLTSISLPLAKYYTKKYKRNVSFIPNGISLNQKIDIEAAEILLSRYKIAKPFLMFSARRIMSTKGLHTMLEAISQLENQMPILISGDESHAERYVKNLKKKYNHLDLIFSGYLDLPVLLGLIKKSKLFIFPSEIEGMSIMLLEVVSIGTHIICSDIPENKQVFYDDEILFFKNKDAIDLAQKIKLAIENPNKMEILKNNALKKIRENYSWKSITDEYEKIYFSF